MNRNRDPTPPPSCTAVHLGLPVSRRMRGLVYMASRDKVDVDTLHNSIQYALEKLGKSKFGFERTAVSNFKNTRYEGSENKLVDYSRALCLGADQKARGLWERDWLKHCMAWLRNLIGSFPVFRSNLLSCVGRLLRKNAPQRVTKERGKDYSLVVTSDASTSTKDGTSENDIRRKHSRKQHLPNIPNYLGAR